MEKIERMMNDKKTRLLVDLDHLRDFDADFAQR